MHLFVTIHKKRACVTYYIARRSYFCCVEFSRVQVGFSKLVNCSYIFLHLLFYNLLARPKTRQGPWVLEHPTFFKYIKDKNYVFCLHVDQELKCENAIYTCFHKTKRIYQVVYLFIKLLIYISVHPSSQLRSILFHL